MPSHFHFRGQDYQKLKQQCKKSGELFIDDEFPPTDSSLYLDENRRGDIVWKRPGELVDDPHLFVKRASINGVVQGILNDCWFLSACSALTHYPHLLKKVIPDAEEQEWSSKDKKKYAGIFRFCFWRFGKWTDVVIDDLLPTRNGKLLFVSSKIPNEFWSALLEKAFAKLYGCYENLAEGQPADALQDVSGGIPETIHMKRSKYTDADNSHVKLFNHLREAFENRALMAAAIAATEGDIGKPLECGLLKGHAYAITDVRYIELDAKDRSIIFFIAAERIRLIRLQNPLGEKEWNGAWSDTSEDWKYVSEARKKVLGLTIDEDGEFWMPFDEFCKHFTQISVCQLFNTSIFSPSKRYIETTFFGAWKAGRRKGAPDDRAGGCFSDTFCSNPQYRFDIKENEESTVMMSLTQREQTEGRNREPFIIIGIYVMKVEANREYRLHQTMPAIGLSNYVNMRSTFLALNDLQPGRYVVVLTTYGREEEVEFMFQLYTSHSSNACELTEHKPSKGLLGRKFDVVTRLTVIQAHPLQAHKDSRQATKLYCIARSEKDTARSPSIAKTCSPTWNWSVVFYRENVRKPIELELWDENVPMNTFLGKAIIAGVVDNARTQITVPLRDRNGADVGNSLGTLTVEIASYDDLVYL